MFVNSYVVGLAFDISQKRIVLIEKNRPDWQKGKLNGIGGKVEKLESIHEAMSREFQEEAGLKTMPYAWRYFLCLNCIEDKTSIHFFTCNLSTYEYHSLKQTTDEELRIITVENLHHNNYNAIHNLKWIIRMAKDPFIMTEPLFIQYGGNPDTWRIAK